MTAVGPASASAESFGAPVDTFRGRSALIFGGAKGIGRAVAIEFARRGAAVAVADIDAESAEATAVAIGQSGGQAFGLSCDVTQDSSVATAISAAEGRLGGIDIVVNNVGAMLSGNPEDIPMSEWRRMFELNLFSVVRSNEILLPKFLARGSGHIVNTASFAGLYPYAINRLPYAAAKAAVIAISESLALYLMPKGIRVTCFCPGPVMTGVAEGIKHWSPDAPMVGPGSQYSLKTPDQVALLLADGMASGAIVVPSDELAWEAVQRHAASPDQFLRAKAAEIARGEYGKPSR